MTHLLLDIRDLSVAFPGEAGLTAAVQGVSLTVQAGETVGVVGESGSGKSVTSLAIIGLLSSNAQITGEIWFHHPDVAEPVNLVALSLEQRRTYRGGQIAMIFQEPMTSLNPVLTCGHQLIEALRLHSALSHDEAEQRAIALFHEVKLPDPETMMHRYPHQISGGQIQRVMIAMALSGNPSLLIADEPTTALDVTIQATILNLLREIRERRNMSILFITHDMGVVSQIADRVLVMYGGQVMETAPVYELFANPQHPYTQGLLNCRPRPSQQLKRLPTVSDFMQVSTNAEGQVEIIAQSASVIDNNPRFEAIAPEAKLATSQQLQHQSPLLTVRNLTKSFPMRSGWFGQSAMLKAVNDVSFEVYPGETLGLVGESGCGKSTLSRVLLRLIEPTSGEVFFDGQSVLTMNAAQMRRVRREMQIVFQNPYGALDARQTVGSAIAEPMIIHQLEPSADARQQQAIALLERVGLDASVLNRYPHEFSGGQRQRICIARVLACRPRFIICDESVSALDVSVQAQVLNLLKDLQDDFGLTYIFISHDLNVVKFVSDRIMVMNTGCIEEIGSAEAIYRNPTRDYTRQLIAAIPNPDLEEILSRQRSRQLSLME